MIITGYSCSNNNDIPSTGPADCHLTSFIENYAENYQKEDVYFIKGIASNFEHEGGLNIKPIEDLKRNFPENVNTFIAWGGYNPENCFLNRLDNLSIYKNQDTLIMLLTPSSAWQYFSVPEKRGDFATITCAFSVLRLSDGFVTGYILPYEEKDKWWENMSQEESNSILALSGQIMFGIETIPWEELYEKLQKLLIKPDKP